MSNNFWQNIEQYREMGYDPLRWISGCTLGADPQLVRNVFEGIKRRSFKVAPSWFDPYFHIEGKEPEVTRRIYDLANPSIEKEVEVKRALSLFRIHTSVADSANKLGETLAKFFQDFKTKVAIVSAPIVTTEHKDAQFAMLDYVQLHRGDKDGYMPALSSFEQITDPTKGADDEIHVKIALTEAIERLNLLGCGNPSLFKFFPIYDAPTEEMLDRIRTNLDAFMSRYNLSMEDYSSLKKDELFYGTSATSITNKELPTRYSQVEEGMEVMLTNKFGGLESISLHALTLSDSAGDDVNKNSAKFEQAGLSLSDLHAAREEALKSLSEPHFALGKIISKYCPEFEQAYDKTVHITAVYPVGVRGAFALSDLAESAGANLVINSIPLRHELISRLATKEAFVENATASQHGCHLIVGTKQVLDLISEELRQHHFIPEKIGMVATKQQVPSVTIRSKEDIGQYIANKSKLNHLFKMVAS